MIAGPVFRYERVDVAAGGVGVLHDVTVDIADRCITVVTGPSGAGKTTFLRLANRFAVPSNGTVRFRGDDIADLDPLELRRRVGMVFQAPVLLGGTVADELRVARPDATDAELVDGLAAAGLEMALDRPGGTLSGGEAQRVCLARALLNGPEVLLLDEPTTGLDGAARRQVEDAVRHLAKERAMPTVWVSHDADQRRRVADHVIVLDAGRVVAEGPPSILEDLPDAER